MIAIRLPHPLLLLLGGVGVAAALTWVLPAGEYDRRDDTATGRRIVVAGTYHRVDAAPVGAFAAAVAVPRGFVEAAEVVAVILIVGGAWVVVDRVGTLSRIVSFLVWKFRRRRLWAIPVLSLFFGAMGALENMQEEIIPLVPVLLALGAGLGVDAVAVVAMSTGAAMIGSAFGPTNPFQAGIALKLAELPLFSAGGLRLAMFALGLAGWIGWTMRYAAAASRRRAERAGEVPAVPLELRDALVLTVVVGPLLAYVYGASARGWGFNELSGAFLVGGFAAGLIGGLGWEATTKAYLDGMQGLVTASFLVGVARAISVVLGDGRVIDTILHALAAPLGSAPALLAPLLMIPFHMIVHVLVPSVSGQAVLTMPVLVPLSDLVGLSRQVTVLAYQTGAGLCELLTPTNGALMAVLLAAGVPLQRWLRFAAGGVALMVMVGIAAIGMAMWMGL